MMTLKCLCMTLEESYRYGNGLSAIKHLNDSDHVCNIDSDDLLPSFGYYIVHNEKVYYIKKGYIYDSNVFYIATESEYAFDKPDYDANPTPTNNTVETGAGEGESSGDGPDLDDIDNGGVISSDNISTTPFEEEDGQW